MSEWSDDLSAALANGNADYMRSILRRVPKDVLLTAVPYLEALARSRVKEKNFEEALLYYNELVEIAPETSAWHAERADIYIRLDRLEEALIDAGQAVNLDPRSSAGHRLLARAHESLRNSADALRAYRKAHEFEPDDNEVSVAIERLERQIRQEMLARMLDPSSKPSQPDGSRGPRKTFDPVLFANPAMSESFDAQMVDGIRLHLWCYSGLQSIKNVLQRVEDPEWMSAWDRALQLTSGGRVLFGGSELGLFALRAMEHGATRAMVVESFPDAGRIAAGLINKNLLVNWHAQHGTAIGGWTEEERRASFEEFASAFAVVAPDSNDVVGFSCEYFVFANIDHSLLGTGIAKAIRKLRERELSNTVRVLPRQARIFACGIQWAYPGVPCDLRPLNQLRWNFHPQALDLPADCWTRLTDTVVVGDIDFEQFAEMTIAVELPVLSSGTVDAILFWFDLDLGPVSITNAPGSPLQCLKPAVQYTDAVPVETGQTLRVRAHVRETRLYFETEPPVRALRWTPLPGWQVPMSVDEVRNETYAAALQDALSSDPTQEALDISADCGLLAMIAARAGAPRVTSGGAQGPLAAVAREIVQLNHFEKMITIVEKDYRSMSASADMGGRRAHIAVLELFDCSLIGQGALHYLAHAREHLLEKDARIIPSSAAIRGVIIEYRLNRVWDLDVELLNPYRFSPAFINVNAGKLRYRALTEPFTVFSFDFSTANPTPEERTLVIPTLSQGVAGAVLFWFELQLTENLRLSNAPGEVSAPHWKQGLQFLPELNVGDDDHLPITAKHNGSSLRFEWTQDAVDKKRFSKLPRLDPRIYLQMKELEQQTRDLMQHCSQNADEHAKVMEIAARFAIDPGAHDLDPVTAQRFATTLLDM